MNVNLDVPIFFMRDDIYSDLFCEMIHEQHNECCNRNIDECYISTCFNEFTNGYMILGESSKETKNFRGYQFFIKAFVLFEYKREKVGANMEGIIRGKVICCNQLNKGLGWILLNKVKEFALVRGVKRWIIFALARDTLITYYERYGFNQRRLDRFSSGKLKTVLMSMNFCNGIDLYDYDKNDGSCFEIPNLDENSIPDDEEYENKFTDLFAEGIIN